MDGSSTIEQPEPTTRKAFSLTAAQRAPLSVLSAALASFCFLFFLSCFLETCSTGMFLTAGALKSIFLLVCHRLDGTTIERFAMHRSKRLEAKSITDQMIRFRRPEPHRLCMYIVHLYSAQPDRHAKFQAFSSINGNARNWLF